MAKLQITRSVLIKALFSVVILAALGITGYYLATNRVHNNDKLSGKIAENNAEITKIAENLHKNQASLKKEIQQLKSLNSSLNKELDKIKKSVAAKKITDLVWFTNPQNGHKYALTPFAMPWQMAENFAKEQGGHLVAIENADENAYLVETFGGQVEYWTGLTDLEDEGKWKWTNGERLLFTNWAAKEPDNYKQMQHNVIFNKQISRNEGKAAGFWNDVSGNDIRVGIVEISK